MDSIYSSFSSFMKKSTDIAKSIDDFGKAEVFEILSKILSGIGWQGFLALTFLLSLGTYAFGVTLVSFIATPIGITIAVTLGIAAVVQIKKLYQNRIIPLAIREVGNKVRPRYKKLQEVDNHKGIDDLCNECARMIVQEAHEQMNKSVGREKWI